MTHRANNQTAINPHTPLQQSDISHGWTKAPIIPILRPTKDNKNNELASNTAGSDYIYCERIKNAQSTSESPLVMIQHLNNCCTK